MPAAPLPAGERHAVVTGGAGFIGSSLVDALVVEGGWRVTVLDDFDPYYDPAAKQRNLAWAMTDPRVELLRLDLTDAPTRRAALADRRPDVIVHCAAQPGVRHSLADPAGSYRANVAAAEAALRLATEVGCHHVVMASSSSVYGANPHTPWREDDPRLRPLNPYAAAKLAAERVADAWARRYGLSVPALRLFTVFGPRQRPDLAIHAFARRMLAGEPVPLFGDGSTTRDYTYVDDVVAALRAAMDTPVDGVVPINVGSGRPVALRDVVSALEVALGRSARVACKPSHAGESDVTHADSTRARRMLGWRPHTPLARGLAAFAAWLADVDATAGREATPAQPDAPALSAAGHG